MEITQLALAWTGWPNGENLATSSGYKIGLQLSERKSTQVHQSPGCTVSQVDPSFQLVSTFESTWPGLNRTGSSFKCESPLHES